MVEQLFTTKEVAEMFNIGEAAIRSWCRNNKIKSVRLPTGEYRIAESTINEIIGKHTA